MLKSIIPGYPPSTAQYQFSKLYCSLNAGYQGIPEVSGLKARFGLPMLERCSAFRT